VVLNLVGHPEFETHFIEHFETWTQNIAYAVNQSPESVSKWLCVDLIVYQINKNLNLNKNLLDILIDLVYYGGNQEMITLLSKCRMADQLKECFINDEAN
jgi:hypothetical protein